MKKIRTLKYVILPSFILGMSPFVTIVSCSKSYPKIMSVAIKPSNFFVLEQDKWSGVMRYVPTSKYETTDVYKFNGSEIPYLNVKDYFNYVMDKREINDSKQQFIAETNNGITTVSVTGIKQYGSDERITIPNASCTIDYKEQTITFKNRDMFCCTVPYYDNPFISSVEGGYEYYTTPTSSRTDAIVNEGYTPPSTPYVIDLSKYNIKAYYYNNEGYLPFDLFKNIFNQNGEDCMFYNGNDFYESSTANTPEIIEAYQQYPFINNTISTNHEYAEFCYNLLALTIDFNWGLKDHVLRSDKEKTYHYFTEGAYSALAPYHDVLTSLDPDIMSGALARFLTEQADDGGHAAYIGANILSTRPTFRYRGPEWKYGVNVANAISENRRKEGSGYSPETYDITPYPSTDPDTIWATFDTFGHPDNGHPNRHINYDDVNQDNYNTDLVSFTMWLQKQFKNDVAKKYKNVVIDIAPNGGGYVCDSAYLASYLCGGVTETMWNPIDNSMGKYTVKADIDQDGDFDGDDYLPENVHVWCIVSAGSFSCANKLPIDLKDNIPNKVTFVGDTPGGGACFVESKYHYGYGSIFNLSSHFHIQFNDATLETPHSQEEGVTPEGKYYIPNTDENIANIFGVKQKLYEIIKS